MGSDPVTDVRIIEQELAKYSDELLDKERWLVLNKSDLLPVDETKLRANEITKQLAWKGPVYTISAATGEGCQELMYKIRDYLNQLEKQ